VEFGKQHPGKLNFGSVGSGSGAHLAAELLGFNAGISMTHVPYKGSAQAITEMLVVSVRKQKRNDPINFPGRRMEGKTTSGSAACLVNNVTRRYNVPQRQPQGAENNRTLGSRGPNEV